MIVQSAEIYPIREPLELYGPGYPAVVIHHSVEYTRSRIPTTRKPVHKEAGILPEPIDSLL